MGDIRANAVDIGTNWMPAIKDLDEMRYHAARARSLSWEILQYKTPEEISKTMAKAQVENQKFDEAMRHYSTTITGPAEQKLFDRIKSVVADYKGEEKKIFELTQQNRQSDAEKIAVQSLGKFTEMREAIEEDVKFQDEGATQAVRDAEATDYRAKFILGSAILAAVLVGIAAYVTIFKTVSMPIKALTDIMLRLSHGDLSVNIIGQDRADEIGKMAHAVQTFKENAEAKLKADKAQAEAEQVQLRLKANLDAKEREDQQKQTARAKRIEDLVRSFDANASDLLRSVEQASHQLHDVGSDLTGVVDNTRSVSSAVAAAAEEASANVSTVASATEEMAASIQEISARVSSSAAAASAAVKTSESATDQINELAKAADLIGQIINVISDVAAQTDLLALNATIEAARAGEAGKGFAVVASEVKQLASQTAKATGDISSQVRSIQEATRTAVATVKDVGQTIQSLNQMVSSIAAAIEEQSSATAEISRNTQDVSTATTLVTNRIAEVAQLTQRSDQAAKRVEESSGNIKDKADAIKVTVNQFISEVRAV